MQRKTTTYRIIALSLAFLVFATSTGFSLDIHYCQDRVVNWNIFGRAHGCSMAEASVMSCTHRSTNDAQDQSLDRKKCCDNKQYLFQNHQVQFSQTSTTTAAHHVLKVVAAGIPSLLPAVSMSDSRTPDYARYKPPLITRDISVLLQVFLF